MKSRTDGTARSSHKLNQVQVEGPNWMFIVGGALLSTLSIRLGWKLKQAFDIKQPDNARNTSKDNGKSAVRRRSEASQLHSKLYYFGQDEDGCYHYHSGMSDSRVDMKHTPMSPLSKDGDLDLPLLAISANESIKDNGGVTWVSSPERLELPPKPFHHSNTSDSPCVSESGSDIFSNREVIQKLRQQLKRRDEMILEMQAQITDLQKSLNAQIAQSANLQSQLDCANRELFDSEREIQRLRKAIADYCVADAGSPKKSVTSQSWSSEMVNGHANVYANGYADVINKVESYCAGSEKGRDLERVELLKREVGELKEVIEGKEFLLQSYKEQKAELCTKVKELQLKLASQVPNIL